MRIKRITIKNFRCFENPDPLELSTKVNLFIGNNGGGKSTILDAIAIGLGTIATHLPGISGIGFRNNDLRIANGQKKPYTKITLETYEEMRWDRILKRDKSKATARQIPVSLGVKSLTTFLDERIIDAQNNLQPFTLPLFAHYSVSRAILDIPLRRKGFNKKTSRFAALSDSLEAISRFRSAFIWFYNKENEENRLQKELRSFDASLKELDVVRDAISTMFPDLSDPHIEVNPLRFMIKKEGQPLSLDQLSDGYKTMLGLIIDLSSRFAMANPDMNNPLEAEAIVMIDEIDLHLHPTWQQRVIGDLIRTFPNTQFILTTHSPYVIESLNNHLKKEKIKDFTIENDAIQSIIPIHPNEAKAYLLENNRITNILNDEFGLVDDKLLAPFNAINGLYDKMKEIEFQHAGN